MDTIKNLITNEKFLKRLSIGATIIGAVAGVVSSFADSRVSELKLDEQITDILKKKGIDA